MLKLPNVADVRQYFLEQYTIGNFVTDKSGVKTIELVGASFVADEPSIFGEVNWDYVSREIEWYNSMSLNVAHIPGGAPKIWQQVASEKGEINSNYGWCIYSRENHSQYDNALTELLLNPNSRRAVMIYTRPTMHVDYNRDRMSDFMCTNTVQYLIRDKIVRAVVQMRSNDLVFGYKNDRAWQNHVLQKFVCELNQRAKQNYSIGDIIWNVGSLHMYERHFNLLLP